MAKQLYVKMKGKDLTVLSLNGELYKAKNGVVNVPAEAQALLSRPPYSLVVVGAPVEMETITQPAAAEGEQDKQGAGE